MQLTSKKFRLPFFGGLGFLLLVVLSQFSNVITRKAVVLPEKVQLHHGFDVQHAPLNEFHSINPSNRHVDKRQKPSLSTIDADGNSGTAALSGERRLTQSNSLQQVFSVAQPSSSPPPSTDAPCSALNQAKDKCLFVSRNKDCQSFPALFDYLHWVFCDSVPLAVTCTMLFLWLLLLLFLLGTVAEDHFCPALSHLSETLRLPPDVAGITFLAFGNGSPDVFATVAAVQKGAFTISLGALTGAGAFVTMVVVGSVALVSDATLQPYPVVRDIVFYLVALAAITVVCLDGQFTLIESILCLTYYLFYVSLVFVVHVCRNKWAQRRRAAELRRARLRVSQEKRRSLAHGSRDGNKNRTTRGEETRPLLQTTGQNATFDVTDEYDDDDDNDDDDDEDYYFPTSTILVTSPAVIQPETSHSMSSSSAEPLPKSPSVQPVQASDPGELSRESFRIRSSSDVHIRESRLRSTSLGNDQSVDSVTRSTQDGPSAGVLAAATAFVEAFNALQTEQRANQVHPNQRRRAQSIDLGRASVPEVAVGGIGTLNEYQRRSRPFASFIGLGGAAAAAHDLGKLAERRGDQQLLYERELSMQRRQAQILWKRGIRLDPVSHNVFVGEPAAVREAFAPTSGSLRRLTLATSQPPGASFSGRFSSSRFSQRGSGGDGIQRTADVSRQNSLGASGASSVRSHSRGRFDDQDPRPLWANIIDDYADNRRTAITLELSDDDDEDGDNSFAAPPSLHSSLNHRRSSGGEMHGWASSPPASPHTQASWFVTTCSGDRWMRRIDWALDVVDWEDKSTLGRTVFVLTLPFTSLFWLSIPHVEDEVWSRRMAAFSLLGAGGVIVVAFGLQTATLPGSIVPIWLVTVLTGGTAGLLLWWVLRNKSSDPNNVVSQRQGDGTVRFYGANEALRSILALERRPHGALRFALACFAFFMSVIWIYLVANELVALLQTFAALLQIREDLLGMTVLAWGNSVGDFVSNTVVARAGFPEMAIGATYGGPMFNLVVGLGLGMTISNIRSFPESYPVELTDAVVNALIFLVGSLLLTLLVVGSCFWRIPRFYGIVLIGIYALFSVGAVLTELDIITFLGPK